MITLNMKSEEIISSDELISQNWQKRLLQTGNCYFKFTSKQKLAKRITLNKKSKETT